MEPKARVEALIAGANAYAAEVSEAYDEVVEQVAARVDEAGSLGKLDLEALTAWKRLRADTRWMGKLMSWPDHEVRLHTERAVIAARDETKPAPDAGAAARAALTALPGFAHGDAIASAVCFVAAPTRMAVYDRRAHRGLHQIDLPLDNRPGRYRRYLLLIEQCRRELADQGHAWTARQVDVALYQLGRPTAT
jgi:hypothetical protein